jgi:ATP/ADP translocase
MRQDNLATRLFRIYPAEIGLTLSLGFLLFVNSMAQQISGVVAVSGFLSEVGTNEILLVWVVNYALVALVAMFQSLVVDRFSRAQLIGYVCLGFAAIYLGIRVMFALALPGWLTYSLIYIISDQQWLFFPLVFWVFANDSLDMSQAKRLFPLFGSIGFIGKILGIIVAGLSPTLLQRIQSSAVELTTLIAVLYVLAFLVVRFRLSGLKVRETVKKDEPVRKMLAEAWAFIGDIPLFRFLAYSVALLIACHIIIEFHFMVVSSERYPDGTGFQQFYSIYRLGVAVTAFLLQTFVTSRLLERLTLKNAFLVMPLSVMGGFLWMLGAPSARFASGVGGMVLNRLPRDTIDEATHKSLLSLVPEERRGRVGLFMDNGMLGVGSVAGCLLTGLVVIVGQAVAPESYTQGYLVIGLALAVLGTVCVLKARAEYDKSLLSWRLKRRQRATTILNKLDF